MKKTTIIVLAVLAVAAAAALAWPRQSTAPQATPSTDQPAPAAPTSTAAAPAPTTTDQVSDQPAQAATSAPILEPKPTEPAAKPAQPKEPGYTSAEVATHNQFEDCWLIIAGKVYDLTTYLGEHPGGSAVVAAYCGREATQAFDTKGGEGEHSDKARADLSKYYLGPLK